jgi:hypothetical protein
MRCKKCGRRLTDPVSIKHQYGPECIKSAVAAGQAPIVALSEMAGYKRSIRIKATKPEFVEMTGDLFGDGDE